MVAMVGDEGWWRGWRWKAAYSDGWDHRRRAGFGSLLPPRHCCVGEHSPPTQAKSFQWNILMANLRRQGKHEHQFCERWCSRLEWQWRGIAHLDRDKLKQCVVEEVGLHWCPRGLPPQHPLLPPEGEGDESNSAVRATIMSSKLTSARHKQQGHAGLQAAAKARLLVEIEVLQPQLLLRPVILENTYKDSQKG